MKRILLLVLMAAIGCSVLSAAGQIRVQVFVLGTDAFSMALQKDLEHRFESIPDVLAVGKEPDYIVTVLASRSASADGDIVAIAAYAAEIPERALGAAMLDPKARPDDIHNVGLILGTLERFAGFDQQVGPQRELGRMCTEIVAHIDQIAFADERAYPRGGDRDQVFMNFMGRIGAKRVITKQ